MKSNHIRGFELKYLAVMSVLLCVAVLIPRGQVRSAWNPPTAPPPEGNVAAPINTSSTAQTKQGDLTLDGNFLKLSSGSVYISNINQGVFWANVTNIAEPHINFLAPRLYISAGDTPGNQIELQGSVNITNADTNDGSLSVKGLEGCFGASTVKADPAGKLYCDVDGGGGGDNWTLNGSDLSPKVLSWNIGIGTTTPNQELGLNGDLAIAGGLYKLNGTTKFFADCPAGNSIRAIAADGTVTCEFDDFGAAGSDTFTVKTDGSGGDSPNFLASEISAGANIALATVNVGGDIKLQISAVGGGSSLWEGTSGDNINPISPAATKVRIGWSGVGDATQLSVENNSANSAIYGHQAGSGYAGYFSGKTVVMDGSVGIGTTTPNQELGLNGDLAIAGGLYKLNGTTKFFADCPAGNSIRAIAADGTVTCEFDDSSGGTGDNLGDHIARANLKMSNYWISNDGDAEGLYIDTAGKVGLGTNVPASKFNVYTATGSPTVVLVQNSTTGNTGGDGMEISVSAVGDAYVGSYENRFLNLGTQGRNDLSITGAGRVGIGTTTPNQELGLNGDLALSGGIFKSDGSTKFFADSCSGANLSIKTIAADGTVTCETDDGGSVGDNLGDHIARANLKMSNYWVSNDGDAEGVYVNAAGKVGVGTNTPQSLLNLYTATASTSAILLQNSFTGHAAGDGLEISVAGTGEAYVGTYENTTLSLGTQGRNDLNIIGTGNVGIGTASPERSLHVNGTIGQNNGQILEAKDNTGGWNAWMWPRWTDNVMYTNFGSGGWNIRNNASTNVMYMLNGGQVGIGNTNPSNLLTVASSGTPYTTNHTIAGYNGVTSNPYNAIAGFKSGAATKGSGVYGELVSGSTCAGTCSGIYGSNGGNVGTNQWAGYFDGDIMINGVRAGRGPGGVGSNTVFGLQAGNFTATTQGNTAIGTQAMFGGSPFAENTAVGYQALRVTGSSANVAVGSSALLVSNGGASNTAVGTRALLANASGSNNVGVGYLALENNISGNDNIAIGRQNGPSTGALSNTISIGLNATTSASNTIRLGNASITSISGQVAFTFPSDVRLKENIQDSNLGLSFINSLRPVQYNMKNGNGKTDLGFVAQDIERLISPDKYNMLLIDNDADHTRLLRYNDLMAPMVKAIQEQNKLIEEQGRAINDLTARLNNLEQKQN